MPAKTQSYVQISDLTDQIPVDSSTLRRWCKAGLIKGAKKLGKTWMIPKSFASDPQLHQAG